MASVTHQERDFDERQRLYVDDEKCSCSGEASAARWDGSKGTIATHNRYICAAVIQILLIVLYTGVFYGAWTSMSSVQNPRLLPLPARDAVRWELRHFKTDITHNALAGDPRPELDQLISPSDDNIAVPKSDVDVLGLKTVYLKDGSSAVVSLGVFHGLHCLKKARQMAFRDYYHGNKDEKAMAREQKHVDHCIEYIREMIMCKADLSFVTYHWINHTSQHKDDPSAIYPTTFDVSEHECVNWESLENWSAQRGFDSYDTDSLRKPKHGLEYDD